MTRQRQWLAIVAIAGLSLLVARGAQADTGSWMHSAQAEFFGVNVTQYQINHTWAESLSNDAGSFDLLQDWPGQSPCIANGNSGCAGHRPSFISQWYASNGTNRGWFTQCYRNSSPGTYAWNGVCHQASNRALNASSVPFVSDLPIGGGGVSYNIFHYCGTSWPWGNWYDCGC
jgi:hypothetical protein